ncbi:Gfo/Idh/MocA family oxidoreductase [Patescibacteria group bacterium]|nr:Gfo/Idh/MocA family oxidoreductase [Patescibacteria group bacterium]
MNKLKIIKPLIIGLGVAGKRHLEAQLKLGFQTGVYSLNFKKTDPIGKQDNVIIFDNLEEAIEWSNLVHVCTPDDKHTEYVAMALKKGKAVLCEKSFTTNLEDALFLQKLAHKYNCLLIIGQNYRLTPTFAEIKKRVLVGDLGTIKKIETTYLHDRLQYQQRAPLRKNQDFLYIAGSHAVDLACWIADEEIVNIKASSENILNYQISIKFSSGIMGSIKLDAISSRPVNGTDLIVGGDKGKLVSHNKLDKLLFYEIGNRKPRSTKFLNTQTHTTALEVKIIDDYLLGKRNSYWPIPNVDEAINTIKILDAVEKTVSKIICQ